MYEQMKELAKEAEPLAQRSAEEAACYVLLRKVIAATAAHRVYIEAVKQGTQGVLTILNQRRKKKEWEKKKMSDLQNEKREKNKRAQRQRGNTKGGESKARARAHARTNNNPRTPPGRPRTVGHSLPPRAPALTNRERPFAPRDETTTTCSLRFPTIPPPPQQRPRLPCIRERARE